MWMPKIHFINPMINEDGSYCLFINDELIDISKELFEKLFIHLDDIQEEQANEYIHIMNEYSGLTEEEIIEKENKKIVKDPRFQYIKNYVNENNLSKEDFIEETLNKFKTFGLSIEDVPINRLEEIYDNFIIN